MMPDNDQQNVTRPLTGAEYLESLRDGRDVWIYGKRVEDVTTHPAFRNSARMTARMYDALHDPKTKDVLTSPTDTGSGGYTHKFFKAAYSAEELVAGRDAIAQWQRIGYGWMGRSPDYKAAYLATLKADKDFYTPYQANAERWYRECQEKVLYLNHALVDPPIDRQLPIDEVEDAYVHVVKESDAGIIVSGAKVVATNSALTHINFVAGHGGSHFKKDKFAAVFLIPVNTPGVKLICRPSYEMTAAAMGTPFDYPLSSRFDENDAIFILDNVLIPWENVLIYRDIPKFNACLRQSGFTQRHALHGCTRLAVKLDFILGLLLKAVEIAGTDQFRGVQVNVGEVVAWRNLFWGLSDAMVRSAEPWHNGTMMPNAEYAMSYRVMMTIAYPKVKNIISNLVASGLIYQPSSALDFQSDELRPYLDKYVRGSRGVEAVDRIKLMKLLWDAVGTEFAGRHELYELNYSGNHEDIRRQALFQNVFSGQSQNMKDLVDQCMAEYDLDGWTTPDLVNPTDINVVIDNVVMDEALPDPTEFEVGRL